MEVERSRAGDQPADDSQLGFDVRGNRPIFFLASVGTTLRLFVSPLAESLRVAGLSTVAASSGRPVAANGFDRVHEMPAFRRSGIKGMAKALPALYDLVRAEQPCLLHLHTPPALIIGRLVGRRLGVPSIAVIHGTFLEPFGYRSLAFGSLETLLARLSDRTVVMNEDDRRFYQATTAAGSVSMAPVGGMGINVTRVKAAMARRAGKASGAAIIVVGRLTAEKNLDLIMEAFQEVRRHQPTATLTFVGSVESGDRPWKVPVGEAVGQIGWLEDPYPVMAEADLLVSASRREGFALVVAEALLLGLPVVAVSNRGVKQIQRVERERLVVVKNSASTLAAAILSSLSLGRRDSIDERLADLWSVQSAVRFHAAVIRNVTTQHEAPGPRC